MTNYYSHGSFVDFSLFSAFLFPQSKKGIEYIGSQFMAANIRKSWMVYLGGLLGFNRALIGIVSWFSKDVNLRHTHQNLKFSEKLLETLPSLVLQSYVLISSENNQTFPSISMLVSIVNLTRGFNRFFAYQINPKKPEKWIPSFEKIIKLRKEAYPKMSCGKSKTQKSSSSPPSISRRKEYVSLWGFFLAIFCYESFPCLFCFYGWNEVAIRSGIFSDFPFFSGFFRVFTIYVFC